MVIMALAVNLIPQRKSLQGKLKNKPLINVDYSH